MICIKRWANQRKTPIPRSEIIREMKKHMVHSPTTIFAINSLLDKGYIRRAYSSQANKTYFVMIRNISLYAEEDYSQFENK